MSDDSLTLTDSPFSRPSDGPPDAFALVVAWDGDEGCHQGEALIVPDAGEGGSLIFGRGSGSAGDGEPRAQLLRLRPGKVEPGAPVTNPRISRAQLRLAAHREAGVTVERVGRSPLYHNGRREPVERVLLGPGDTLQVGQSLLFVVVRRRAWLPSVQEFRVNAEFPFGQKDHLGCVGESPAIWILRDRIAFAARRPEHLLITGASGTGKEMVARAVHALGSSSGQLVSRNAATFPEGLIDAELFGNARNYPNAGMAERPGLIGQAHGSTLFLDEIGELPEELQAHLLRVLDQGEYQRLGESRTRAAKFRLIGATNRPASVLKVDLMGRLPLRIEVPDLDARREDIPLLAEHVLREILESEGDMASATAERRAERPTPQVRISLALMNRLVRHEYRTHVRELRAILLEALRSRTGPELDWFERAPAAPTNPGSPRPPPVSDRASDLGLPPLLEPEAIQQALDRNRGSLERSWRELGLSSRHALARLIVRHRLRAGRTWTANTVSERKS